MFTKMIDGLRSYVRAVESRRAFEMLSDAALADIGLPRFHIASLYARPAPVRPTRPWMAGLSLPLALPATAQAA